MPDQPYPPQLLALLALIKSDIGKLTDRLSHKEIDLAAWQAGMLRLLMRYSIAAAVLGQGESELTGEAEQVIIGQVRGQVPFLSRFAADIETGLNTEAFGGEWQTAWDERAKLYGESVQVPYWQGVTRFLKLPAYPGDGSSECLMNDRCQWLLHTLDADKGDYNAFWKTEQDKQVCATCEQRGKEWSPLKIRGFHYG